MAVKTKAKQIALAAISGLTNASGDVQGGIASLQASKVGAIAADSQNYLSIVNGNELHVKELLIVSVVTDNTYADLAARITGTGYDGTQMQMGDTLILAAATGGTQIYINNGLNGGTSADFTLIRNPDVTPAYIRSQLSAGNGISYNSTTGVISAKVAAVSALQFVNTSELAVKVDDTTIEINPATNELKIMAAGVGRTELNNTSGAVDADYLIITGPVATATAGDSIQSALEALDAKQEIGARETGVVACPVSVASTNFNVTVPHAPIATQSQVYSINGIRELAVSVSGTTVTFNVPYAVDATDEVEYEYFY